MRGLWSLVGALALALSGCGGDGNGSPDAGVVYASITVDVGPEGGEVMLASGVKVEIPPGALNEMRSIKVSEKNPALLTALSSQHVAAAEKPVAFEPHGLQFAQPVKIELPFDTDDATLMPVKLDNEEDTTWAVVTGAEKTENKLTLQTTSFSVYWPVRVTGVVTLPDGGGDAFVEVDAGVDAGSDAGADAMVGTSVCDFGNGGCDLLSSCTPDADGAAICGTCPTGYAGTGDALCVPVLTDLMINPGPLSPTFDSSTLNYTASYNLSVSTLDVTPTAVSGVDLLVNGASAASGAVTPVVLQLGTNTITTEARRADSSDVGTSYETTVTRGLVTAYAKGSVARAGDLFGNSVSLSGDTLVVGVPGDDSASTGIDGSPAGAGAVDSGAAYVFVNVGGTWLQQAYLKASNAEAGDEFGYRVSIDGDTLAVSARYEEGSGIGVGGNPTDNGAPDSGAVYVFVRSGGVWTQQAYLKASNTGSIDRFGESLDLSGDLLIAGAPLEGSAATGVNGDSSNNTMSAAGAAYIFRRVGVTWTFEAYLKASNTEASDFFGWGVAIDGNLAAVGAIDEDSASTGINANGADNSTMYAGAVYTYVAAGTTWSFDAYIKPDRTDVYGAFGSDLDLEGTRLVVSAHGDGSSASGIDGDPSADGGGDSGAVYLYNRSAGSWSREAYIKAALPFGGELFGSAVSLSGDRLAVGCTYEGSGIGGLDGDPTNAGAFRSGAAYLFERIGGDWTETGFIKAAHPDMNDNMGWRGAVAVSGARIAVGVPNDDSGGTGFSGDSSDNSVMDTGAVYVIE